MRGAAISCSAVCEEVGLRFGQTEDLIKSMNEDFEEKLRRMQEKANRCDTSISARSMRYKRIGASCRQPVSLCRKPVFSRMSSKNMKGTKNFLVNLNTDPMLDCVSQA